MSGRNGTAIVWMRRDLRLDDHAALAAAARAAERVVCAFVLDDALLRSQRVGAPIVAFFFEALAELRTTLRARGSDLALLRGVVEAELSGLARRTGARTLYYNVDDDPAARVRDERVARALRAAGTGVSAVLDQTYFGSREVLAADGRPYVMFTPYKRRWLERFHADPRPPLRTGSIGLLDRSTIGETQPVPALETFGFRRLPGYPKSGARAGRALLARFAKGAMGDYARDRNAPALDATSHLSPHLRAGTIGIRTCVAAARDQTWLAELIWRDFYAQILANFPQVANEPFLPRAARIPWRSDEAQFVAWCNGATGYPFVDAAMRQLAETGWMHNRARMVVASFLSKDLLIDYRCGEAHFERSLADADLASNNGGWQWAASTGTDAAPYFRIFNPVKQSRTFDPSGAFIRRFVPELAGLDDDAIHAPWLASPLLLASAGVTLGATYPFPLVDHEQARIRALAAFGSVFGAAVKT